MSSPVVCVVVEGKRKKKIGCVAQPFLQIKGVTLFQGKRLTANSEFLQEQSPNLICSLTGNKKCLTDITILCN